MGMSNFATNPDPLGIGLKERAREHNRQYAAQNRELGRRNGQLVSFSLPNYLADPTMDAFKQSLYENADKVGGSALPQSQFGESTTFSPEQGPLASLERARRGYDVPGNASLEGLQRVMGRPR